MTTMGEETMFANVLAEAPGQIDLHRKADATVIVKDRTGKPVPGATVKVEQQRHEYLFGCNLYRWGQIPDEGREQAYRRQFADLFNSATLAFYWWLYETERGKPDYEYTDRVCDWCEENGIACKGHPLVWNFDVPEWLPDGPEEIGRLSDARVTDVVSRYRGKIDIWDVVNEVSQFDNFPNRMTDWISGVGAETYVKSALRAARQANPEATLLVNDVTKHPAHVQFLAQLLEDAPGLFDAAGMQTHMYDYVYPPLHLWGSCEGYREAGVPLHFTETTVLSAVPTQEGGWTSKGALTTTPEGEQWQADYVERLYTTLFSHPATKAITWWDFSDDGAFRDAPSGLLRADMSPKPAYDRLRDLIKGRWWTNVDGVTDEQGRFSLRAFHGTHRVTATASQRQETSCEAHIRGDGKNEITVVV